MTCTVTTPPPRRPRRTARRAAPRFLAPGGRPSGTAPIRPAWPDTPRPRRRRPTRLAQARRHTAPTSATPTVQPQRCADPCAAPEANPTSNPSPARRADRRRPRHIARAARPGASPAHRPRPRRRPRIPSPCDTPRPRPPRHRPPIPGPGRPTAPGRSARADARAPESARSSWPGPTRRPRAPRPQAHRWAGPRSLACQLRTRARSRANRARRTRPVQPQRPRGWMPIRPKRPPRPTPPSHAGTHRRSTGKSSGSRPGVASQPAAGISSPCPWLSGLAHRGGRAPLIREEPLYRDVASSSGIRWELLAACDWMQCEARTRYSPVHGEKLAARNTDGTIYRTKSEALAQCADDLVDLAAAVYQHRPDPPAATLSVRDLANASPRSAGAGC